MTTTFERAGSEPRPATEVQVETPFLETAPAAWAPTPALGESMAESPFLSEYGSGEQTTRPEEPALRELLEDLYDAEFDEAVAELAAEAETYVAELGLDESESDQARAEQLLDRWVEPLRREAQTMLMGLAEAFDSEDSSTMTEDRFEAIFEQFAPAAGEHGPTFEGFLGSLVKKAKSIAKGAIKAAKAGVAAVSKIMPIGIILRKLAGLARPLLDRVLKFALNKLPAQYRDPARLLAQRFLGLKVSEALEHFDGEDLDEAEWEWESQGALGTFEQPATADLRQIQDEFDAEAVGLVFAPSEQEQDLYLAEATVAGAATEASPLAALDAARTRFVDRMARLDEAADPTPLVENFLPAILPALRLGVRVAGRPRVVKFLASYLGRLIAPYVGPTVTPGLSRAIVDAGLRAMSLEASEDESASYELQESPVVAAEAFAELVEDTVARVAQLTEAELDHEALVEEAAYTAFHQSAAANFPSEVLTEENEHLERGRARGTWVSMPRSGPWRYRKYSQVFNVVIHPAAARSITTFGGRPLSAFLRDGLGRSGPVRARVHLYQAVPGSSLTRIARAERGVPGLGPGNARARARLHPLTPMAAAALIGEPGLGREVSEVHTDGLGPLAVGQRLYYLEVPNATAAPVATGADTTTATAPSGQPRSSDATCRIDPSGGVVTVTIFTSEADAQAIATRLRRREPVGASLAVLRRIYGPALGASRLGRVRVRSEQEDEVTTEDLLRRPLGLARSYARRGRPLLARRRVYGARRRRPRFVRRPMLVSWVSRALAAEMDRSRDAFVEAADAPADGVTIVLRLRPSNVRAVLSPGAASAAAAAGPGQVEVEITPGPPRA